jgi:hypothetical protein
MNKQRHIGRFLLGNIDLTCFIGRQRDNRLEQVREMQA